MLRAAEYTLDRVLPFIGGTVRLNIDGDFVSVNSLRMRCFKESGVRCVRCGLEGAYFAKEKSTSKEASYHLNLYGKNASGHEILLTHDHIIPRSKGGKNHITNVQTMCQPCNSLKGNGDRKSVQRPLTGVDRADVILNNLYNTVERSGKVHVNDLDAITKLIRSTMVDTIRVRALKPVVPGLLPADFDPHNRRVIPVAPNVMLAMDFEDHTQECTRFYILNVKTGDRLHVSIRG